MSNFAILLDRAHSNSILYNMKQLFHLLADCTGWALLDFLVSESKMNATKKDFFFFEKEDGVVESGSKDVPNKKRTSCRKKFLLKS